MHMHKITHNNYVIMSGVMLIRKLFQCLCMRNTCGMQNIIHEDLAPGWSEYVVGTTPTIYKNRAGIQLVSLRIWNSPTVLLVMKWSDLIRLHSWLQQYNLVYRCDTRPFLSPLKWLAHAHQTIIISC